MMIITTHRSSLGLALDTLLTILGWSGFLYLILKGILILADGSGRHGPILESFLPTAHTLTIYLAIAATNALAVLLWARYHKTIFNKPGRPRLQPVLDDETVASSFHLSCGQLHRLQESRVAVIHHSESGEIELLEADGDNLQPRENEAHLDTRAA